MIQEILSRLKEAEEYYRREYEVAHRRGHKENELIYSTKAAEAIATMIMIEKIRQKHENNNNT